MAKTNLMLIGCGPHAKRIYVPLIKKHHKKLNLELKAVVDIKEKKLDINKYLTEKNIDCKKIYFNSEIGDSLLDSEIRILDKEIKKSSINAIIISSDPTSHLKYIKWALDRNLHILTDKPLTSRLNASLDEKQAIQINKDYYEILRRYKEKEKYFPEIIFSCLSQRRYHPAIVQIKKFISEVYDLTNCPPTSIVCQHSDGQWRMPEELENEKYHGYIEGLGKCSHSGYHFFDIMGLYSTPKEDKKFEEIEVYSNFVRPEDCMSQLTLQDYKNLFGDTYSYYYRKNEEELNSSIKNLGEVDAHINFALKQEGKTITNINFSLLHNGVSKRSWIKSRNDLYKGNGRIRHETHIVHQGPFQALYYVSYQSDQISNESLKGSGEIGGELHSDVYVFRNSKILGVDLPEFEVLHFGKRSDEGLKGYSRGHQEDARGECFKEFILAVKGEIPKSKLRSSIEDHKVGVEFMSLAYQSAARKYNGKNPCMISKIA